jgi:hypothetical protein
MQALVTRRIASVGSTIAMRRRAPSVLHLAGRIEGANVARELIALAYHGGGNLLFGVTETTGVSELVGVRSILR